MTEKLAKLFALSWTEKLVFFEAILLLPVFWLRLHLFGLSRASGVLQPAKSPVSIEEAANLSRLVNVAGKYLPFPSTCLTRALLLDWMLQRRGAPCELRIGVRISRGRLDAHAWIEHAARPVNEAADVSRHFARFDGSVSPRLFRSSRA